MSRSVSDSTVAAVYDVYDRRFYTASKLDVYTRRAGAAADWEAMNIFGNIENLSGCQREFRHSSLGTAVQENGANRFTLLVLENELRPKQIRSLLAAPRVRAVAKAAVHFE